MQRPAFFLSGLFFLSLVACAPAGRLKQAPALLLQDTALTGAHVGIAVYDPVAGRYLYNYQGDHYFVPASNTKLFTCYAAMKYLGDSLVGLRYYQSPDTLYLLPAGDPTFRSAYFPESAVEHFLRRNQHQPVTVTATYWKAEKYGQGWAWDDYAEDYMPERSPLPVYGNTALLSFQYGNAPATTQGAAGSPQHNDPAAAYRLTSVPPIIDSVRYIQSSPTPEPILERAPGTNTFTVRIPLRAVSQTQTIPFVTNGLQTAAQLLGAGRWRIGDLPPTISRQRFSTIRSQPTDSLLRPMMYHSDNFFAEQALLMVSNERLGYMNETDLIDTLLQTDLKDLPQRPVWVDGSGLSRYNLFTPQDFISLLQKMKATFGIERIRTLLPQGNTGTLTHYYQQLGPDLFAKTGSLSGQVALSGYLVCKSRKLLLFSILVNNHNSSGRAVRRAVEKYLTDLWSKN